MSYVRVIYDFSSIEPGEIPLKVGDVVKVLKRVNENWLYGDHAGSVGNFPSAFVEPLVLPTLSPDMKMFIGVNDFQAQESGDLGFQRGEIIVGIVPVDQHWWQGMKGMESGMFPLTHVQEINLESSTPTKPQDLPAMTQEDVPNVKGMEEESQNSCNFPGETTSESQLGEQDMQSNSRIKARANMSLSAQLDDELSFEKGDLINIIEITDDDFAIGECNGRIGQFPLAFVDIMEGKVVRRSSSIQEKQMSRRNWFKRQEQVEISASDNVQTDAESFAKHAVGPEISSDSGYTSDHLVPSVNIDPASEQPEVYSNYVSGDLKHISSNDSVSFKKAHKRTGSYTAVNIKTHDTEIVAYAKVLYSFQSEMPNELSIQENDIVTLIRHVDDQWLEGEIDGNVGLFPASYVEIIVDCEWSDNQLNQEPYQDVEQIAQVIDTSKVFESDTYGRVLYDFHPETDQELELKEGDTITVFRQLDEYWLEAQHDDGRIGQCPVSYIELIGEDPGSAPSSSSVSRSESYSEFGANAERTAGESNFSNVNQANDVAVIDDSHPDTSDTKSFKRPKQLELHEEPSVKSAIKSPISPQTKPQLKPKPALKPKPTALARKSVDRVTPSPVTSPVATSSSPSAVSSSADQVEHNALSSAPVSKQIVEPKAPHRTNNNNHQYKPQSRPSSVIDPKIDDAIQQEMQKAIFQLDAKSHSVKYGHATQRSGHMGKISEQSQQHHRYENVPMNSFQFSEKERIFSSENSTSKFYTPITESPPPTYESVRQTSLPDYESLREPSQPMVAPKKRPPPPRPNGPRPAPAPSRVPLIPTPSSVAQSNLAVPQRRAPSRPAPSRPSSGSSNSSLMATSTDVKMKEIADLKTKISAIDKDLEHQQSLKNTLELQQSQENKDVDVLGEELVQCEDRISSLEKQRSSLTENLSSFDVNMTTLSDPGTALAQQKRTEAINEQKEARKKRKEIRCRVIEEIITTERDYLNSLRICSNVIKTSDPEKNCPQVDIDMLLGNMDEVMNVSSKLISSLDDASETQSFSTIIIGKTFVDLKEEMKRVYAPYCRNHDDVLALLSKYEETPEIDSFFKAILEKMKQQMTVFDIGSVLIKPVQRILKYPLLLNELIKSTEDDHPDKPHLLAAINSMTDVAAAINEFKRRKDLVAKYRKDADLKITDKLARLSMHSAKKKFSRVARSMVGVETKDETFDLEERKFYNLEKMTRLLAKDIRDYMEQMRGLVKCQEDVANDIRDLYSEKESEINQLIEVHHSMSNQLFHQFDHSIEQQVILQVDHLLQMFQGPTKVIKKRYDKLLDYDSLLGRVKSASGDNETLRKLKDDCEKARKDYVALNTQLLDELPTLYALSTDVIRACLIKLVQAQKLFYKNVLDELYKLMPLQSSMDTSEGAMMESFLASHHAVVNKISELSFVTKAFNPKLEDKVVIPKSKRLSVDPTTVGKRPTSPTSTQLSYWQVKYDHRVVNHGKLNVKGKQLDSQRDEIMKTYPQEKLFVVKKDVKANQTMDLVVAKGTVVGVIKEGDPMGDKNRWFIDSGAEKGFIAMKYLTQFKSKSPNPSKMHDQQPLAQPRSSLGGTTDNNMPATSRMSTGSVTDGSNLMDLSSPDKLRSNDATSDGPAPTPYDRKFWEEAVHSPPSILTEETRSSHAAAAADPGASEESPSTQEAVNPRNASLYQMGDSVMEGDLFGEGGDESDQNSMYQAIYTFGARSPIEVDLEAGQQIKVLSMHDLDGNAEWWFVESNGREGYVPASYLYKMT